MEEEGYDIFALKPHINCKIVDLIMDSQLENYDEFEQLVKDSIVIINS
ncbi:hypothetical protein [Haloimpatiens massiliensis]|nr:hypothetical protein [Haloimpatiens massiliensis]